MQGKMRSQLKRNTQRRPYDIYKIVSGILILLFVMLQVELWFGSANPIVLWRLHEGVAERQVINTDWQQRNTRLFAAVNNLKTGANVVEAHARMNLGMIKNGEIYYQVVS